MKESQFLGTLLPSHPDLQPLIQHLREKYNLHEVFPDEEPITKIFLGDKEIPLPEFRQEIKSLVDELPDFMPPEIAKPLSAARNLVKPKSANKHEFRFVPKKTRLALMDLFKAIRNLAEFLVDIFDQFNSNVADMLYIYILTGETQEVPQDWFSKVMTGSAVGEPVVIAMASQVANQEAVIEQFRQELRKTFGAQHPKTTTITVSTAYFMHLQREHKKWDFILEEFIRLNHFPLPRDRNSKRYAETVQGYDRLLRKRIQRSESVLNVLLKDKK